MKPAGNNGHCCDHVSIVLESYYRLTGLMIEFNGQPEISAKAVFNAPFALISHGIEAEPVFNYANKTAMRLFDMTWDEITALASKYSAEQSNREQRSQLLREVKKKGYIEDYSGVRIAKGGRRFYIEQATVWNLTDADGAYYGQAAMFNHWHFV
ncbi:MAG: MEKHLA domain-containing protein [Gammaproteobacteria bacterium]|nr:MEKHLA domain-containing protein [Gammaproteobacteria bacterium]